MITATITYRDKTKAIYTTPKKTLFSDSTFIKILKIQNIQIEKIEINYD